MGIKGRGRSGRSRDSNPACQCCSSAHLVQCEPDEASSFTNPNMGPGTYASLRLKLDAWSSAVQRGQKCSSPTRRLPSRSWGPIRPRVCSWFRAPIRHECQTAQLKSRGECSTCQTSSTIKHVLLECKVFNNTRKHYFHANTMKDLFENVHIDKVLSFLKETGLYQKI